MKRLLRILAFLAVAATPLAAAAATTAPAPVQESSLDRHTRAIAETLRCLVCQGETVADSHASLAADMRTKIREKLKQGWSDQQIRDYFVSRYGDFVLYRPPLRAATWALWFGPPALLLLGLVLLFGYVRARRLRVPDALAPGDSERARALLGAHKESPR